MTLKRIADAQNQLAALRQECIAAELRLSGKWKLKPVSKGHGTQKTGTGTQNESEAVKMSAEEVVQRINGQDLLWPQRIEVLGTTGEFSAGKTLFMISIAPGPKTLLYDTEKSAGTYESLGFERRDVPEKMARLKPKGYKAIETFEWWRDDVRSVKPGKFDVIGLDTASEIETGLVEYVRQHPTEFGYSANQFARAEALLWGAVKDFWKAILVEIATRCQTFAFSTHMRSEFKDGRPTHRRIPKGKETLMELASLYLFLERPKDKKGNVPAVPAAVVLKSRLASTRIAENGLIEICPSLPPRLPVATPQAIRQYMLAPPDYDKLKTGERAEEKEPTEAEIAAMRLQTAEAERETELLKIQRLEQAKAAGQRVSASSATPPVATNGTNGAMPATTPAVAQVPAQTNRISADAPNRATDEQLDVIRIKVNELCDLGYPRENYKAKILAKRGVASARELSPEQAVELIASLDQAIEKRRADKAAPVGTLPGN